VVLHVMLTWSYQSRRVTAVRVAYNALEVVPTRVGTFPHCGLRVEWVTKKGARNTFTNHG
jgi:hypothetical protein